MKPPVNVTVPVPANVMPPLTVGVGAAPVMVAGVVAPPPVKTNVGVAV